MSQLSKFILHLGKSASIDVNPEMALVAKLGDKKSPDWYYHLNMLTYRVLLICLSRNDIETAGKWVSLLKKM